MSYFKMILSYATRCTIEFSLNNLKPFIGHQAFYREAFIGHRSLSAKHFMSHNRIIE